MVPKLIVLHCLDGLSPLIREVSLSVFSLLDFRLPRDVARRDTLLTSLEEIFRLGYSHNSASHTRQVRASRQTMCLESALEDHRYSSLILHFDGVVDLRREIKNSDDKL